MESSSNKPEVHEQLWAPSSPSSPIEKFNMSSDVISDDRIDSLAKTSSKQSASHHMPKIEKQFSPVIDGKSTADNTTYQQKKSAYTGLPNYQELEFE